MVMRREEADFEFEVKQFIPSDHAKPNSDRPNVCGLSIEEGPHVVFLRSYCTCAIGNGKDLPVVCKRWKNVQCCMFS